MLRAFVYSFKGFKAFARNARQLDLSFRSNNKSDGDNNFSIESAICEEENQRLQVQREIIKTTVSIKWMQIVCSQRILTEIPATTNVKSKLIHVYVHMFFYISGSTIYRFYNILFPLLLYSLLLYSLYVFINIWNCPYKYKYLQIR